MVHMGFDEHWLQRPGWRNRLYDSVAQVIGTLLVPVGFVAAKLRKGSGEWAHFHRIGRGIAETRGGAADGCPACEVFGKPFLKMTLEERLRGDLARVSVGR